MAESEKEGGALDEASAQSEKAEATKTPRRIPGGLTYLTAPGTLKSVLDKIVSASQPDKFTQDYLATVIGLSGGSARAVLPILKRVGFLQSDGTPTALYAKFRTESGRPEAAYGALRTGFAEIFRRNEHAYAATDSKLTDLIVEITGLTRDDPTLRAIRGTYRVFTGYLPSGFVATDVGREKPADDQEDVPELASVGGTERRERVGSAPYGLSYQINIVLPESKDVEVYNLIFKSLRDNLLRA